MGSTGVKGAVPTAITRVRPKLEGQRFPLPCSKEEEAINIKPVLVTSFGMAMGCGRNIPGTLDKPTTVFNTSAAMAAAA
jgi:hypothetical protein